MRYNVFGLDQKTLVEKGLDLVDAALLDALKSFHASNKMHVKVIDGIPYYWVFYAHFRNEVPIIGINNNDTMRRRFERMVNAGVLIHKTIREGGTFSYYGFGPEYYKLEFGCNTSPTPVPDPTTTQPDPTTPKSDPSDPKVVPPATQKSEQRSSIQKEPLTKESDTRSRLAYCYKCWIKETKQKESLNGKREFAARITPLLSRYVDDQLCRGFHWYVEDLSDLKYVSLRRFCEDHEKHVPQKKRVHWQEGIDKHSSESVEVQEKRLIERYGEYR